MMLIKEKVELYGVEKLVPFESISLITSIDISKLEKFKSFKEIFNNIDSIESTDLQKNRLRALKNIVMYSKKEELKMFKVDSPWGLYKYFMDEMRFLEKEVFKIILLDTKNQIIDDVDISMGTLNSTLVHPREVFIQAIKKNSNSIILMHNHPSGSIEPSNEDKRITERLKKCGEMIGIEVIDHLIIGNGLYYSFKENSMI